MDSTAFSGFAIFVVMAVITGLIGYLAVQQGKIKRQIEESRKQREREELATLAGVDPTGLPSGVPPVITPGATSPSAPLIQPGGTPLPPHSPPGPEASGERSDGAGGHP